MRGPIYFAAQLAHILVGVFVVMGYISSASASQCGVVGESENLKLIVCPSGLDQEAWRIAGLNACASTGGICNAWIWDDVEKAPSEAPATDSEMSKDKTRQALAIWINDIKRLVLVDKVDKPK